MDEIEMIRAWYADSTAEEIAAAHGIEEKELKHSWLMLKRDGKLPKGDRPRSRQHNRFIEDDVGDGGSSLYGSAPIRVPWDDPLLRRLQKHHVIMSDEMGRPLIREKEVCDDT